MRRLRRMTETSLATVALLLCGACAASASPARPLPVTIVGPANGSVIPVRDTLTIFEFESPMDLDSAHIVVATQDTVEPDGGLAPIDEVDYFAIDQSDLDPHIYREVASYPWTQEPGTYYWQIEASRTEQPSDGETESEAESESAPVVSNYVSPVYELVISSTATSTVTPTPAPAAVPTLTLAEAFASVKTLIRSKSGRAPHYLSATCRSQSKSRTTCDARWASSIHRTAPGTWLYDGAFNLEARAGAVSFSFSGHRGRYGCVRRHSMEHCQSKVRWR